MKSISYKLNPQNRIYYKNKNNSNLLFFSIQAIILLILVLFTCGCVSSPSGSEATDKMTIACTIPPQEEFIKAVAGNSDVTVMVMVPPGASPHTFEPTPSQIKGLESADLYIALGSGIEFENQWMDRIQKLYPDLTIINCSRTITLLPGSDHHHEEVSENESEYHKEEGTDPHIWLSLNNAATIVRETCEGMSEQRPDMRGIFEENRDSYLEQLKKVDKQIKNSLKDLPSPIILVYHPAFGYFCNDYSITQMAVEENGHEPSARELGEIIDQAKSLNITLVFTEPESSTRQAETLARELNGKVILISPLAGNYLENMQIIAEKIAGK